MKTTLDYSVFKLIEHNRQVKVDNRLIESIKRKGQLMPIIVNSRFEVIDGQHRLQVLKMLNKPVDYIIRDLTHQDLIHINAHQKAWSPTDYWNYALKLEHPDVIKLTNLMQSREINNLDHALGCYTSGTNNVVKALKNFAHGYKSENRQGYNFIIHIETGDKLYSIITPILDIIERKRAPSRLYSAIRNIIQNNELVDINRLKLVVIENMDYFNLNVDMMTKIFVKQYNKNLKKNRLTV